MSIGRRAVAAVISLVIVAASWVLGLGAFLWTFAATDFRWIAFAVSVLVAGSRAWRFSCRSSFGGAGDDEARRARPRRCPGRRRLAARPLSYRSRVVSSPIPAALPFGPGR